MEGYKGFVFPSKVLLLHMVLNSQVFMNDINLPRGLKSSYIFDFFPEEKKHGLE